MISRIVQNTPSPKQILFPKLVSISSVDEVQHKTPIRKTTRLLFTEFSHGISIELFFAIKSKTFKIFIGGFLGLQVGITPCFIILNRPNTKPCAQ